MNNLKQDILRLIANFCEPKDINNLTEVSKNMNASITKCVCSFYQKNENGKKIDCFSQKYKHMCYSCREDLHEAEEAMSYSYDNISE